MRFIPMNVPARASVTIPQLSGGINLYDTPDMVADNQLTAADNVWWHKGALRTRPGTREEGSVPSSFNLRQPVNERETLLMTVTESVGAQYLFAGLLTTEGFAQFAGGQGYYGTLPPAGTAHTAIGFRTPDSEAKDWYVLLSGGDAVVGGIGQSWETAKPYIPTVLINGKGNKAADEGQASVYEDYNMLTRAFKCQFTTDGVSTAFSLPLKGLGSAEGQASLYGQVELITFDGGTGATNTHTASLRKTADGNVCATLTVTPAEAGETNSGADSIVLTVYLRPETGLVEVWGTAYADGNASGGAYMLALPRVANNNLTVTVYRGAEADGERLTICRMTRCAWFGGDRSGLGGGTRLFLTGNPDKPGLVHWSGVETPLYFPEGNYAYIGEAGEAVTGFGKQGDLLVMYTPHRMAAAQYVAGGEEDYSFAQSGGVAVTGYMAHFPITQLNASIGCDCPDTVRLVNNRLVWADSTGRVYMLTSTSAYSERNVREISRNIRQALAAHGPAALKRAIAGEYAGYYILLVESTLYLLDTQNSAFASFNYYASEDNARKALPWYIWTLPVGYTFTGMTADGDAVRLTGTRTDTLATVQLVLTGETDPAGSVRSTFATKLFDFGRPDHRKSVEQLYVGISSPPGGRIRAGYQTERGVYEDPYELTGRDVQAAEDGAPLRVRLTPHVRQAQLFGLRLSGDSPMTVGSILIKAKQQGAVR